MKGSNADPYVADVALPNAELGDYSVPSDWPTNVRHNAPGDVPGPAVMFDDEELGDVKAGYGFESDNLYEGDWFFFHTDHLGSTSYLTDTAGNVSQFVCYTPYGEAIVDEHLTTYENPFKFSGKELDDITGLYDHGARSRNPISTLWYGVDPLWEKYPDFSPYNYCAGNPVKLVDLDGRDITIAGANKSSITLKTNIIDIKIDLSSQGFDWGGQYVLQGEDIVSAGLDIVGIFDPTGLADAANAGLQAKNGDYLDAGISLLGCVPYVGDLAKAPKLAKDVKIIETAIDAVKTGNKERKALSNAELVQKSANKAERAIGGKGPVAGTKKHIYANQLLKKYQKMYGDRGLITNNRFTNVSNGEKGILDVRDIQNGTIYDFKFGKARMGKKQFNKYHNAFPNENIIIIRPQSK